MPGLDLPRHGRAWPGHPRLVGSTKEDVDARHKAGHDGGTAFVSLQSLLRFHDCGRDVILTRAAASLPPPAAVVAGKRRRSVIDMTSVTARLFAQSGDTERHSRRMRWAQPDSSQRCAEFGQARNSGAIHVFDAVRLLKCPRLSAFTRVFPTRCARA